MAAPEDGVFTYCTRCGNEVAVYQGREWKGDFQDDYDVPVAKEDQSDKRPTDYWCPACHAVWRGLCPMET